MKLKKSFIKLFLLGGLLAMGSLSSQAQLITWTNTLGGEWNTALNWDSNSVPGVGNDASLSNAPAGSYTINYNLPMAAASFGNLSIFSTNIIIFNVNTNGFNLTGSVTARGKNRVFVNSGGALSAVDYNVNSNSCIIIAPGGSVNLSGILGIGNINPQSGGVNGSGITNNGGLLNVGGIIMGGGNDGGPIIINGGTNNLGNITINRSGGGGAGSPPAIGSPGIVISNGIVNTTSVILGANNSWGNLTLVNGIVTNNGDFLVGRQVSANRGGRFTQLGGLMVTTTNAGIRFLVNNAGQLTVFSVLGGTNISEGYVLGDSTVSTGTVNFTNGSTMLVGSTGITNASNGGTVVANVTLNNNSVLAAKADWTGSVGMLLASGGTASIRAADLDGTPHNIIVSGALRGSGSLNKIGAGRLTLSGAHLLSGTILVNAGTLALDATGSLTNSPIIVGSGGIFDVTALAGGFTNAFAKILAGSGVITGAVSVATGGILNPGSNTLNGILSFSNSLSEVDGAATNHFDLFGNPSVSVSNDLVIVAGDLNVSGTNVMEISGSLLGGGVYPLIRYGGNFNGNITNFSLSGAAGVLSNSVAGKTIYLIAAGGGHSPTSLAWVGNSVSNFWDLTLTTNWFNGTTLDYFYNSDTVRFTDSGGINNLVVITNTLSPAATLVASSSNYTFSGTGIISGTGGLTKTNSGTLTILTTNSYSGPTIVNGGRLEVVQIANAGSSSAIGNTTSDPANLVISNATFKYSGADVATTDRGATLLDVATFDIVGAGNLTLGGSVVGSGNLTKIGNGTLSLTNANTYGSSTLSNGTVAASLGNSLGAGVINFAGGTLSLASAAAQQFYANVLNVISTGTIIANSPNGNLISSGIWTNSGTLNISIPNSAGLLTVNAQIGGFTGTVHFTDDTTGSFRLNSGGNATGPQQSTGSSNALFDLGNGSVSIINRNGGGASFGNYDIGALAGGSGTFLRGSANSGSASTYSIGAKNLNTLFSGTIANGSTGPTAIVKVGSGSLSLAGVNTYTGGTIVSNGVLALSFNPTNSTDGSFGSGVINILSGAVLDVSGRSDFTLPLNSGQTLAGNGTLRGILDSTSGGTIAPGGGITGSIGTLTVTNAINLGGTVWAKVNRAGMSSDKLVSSLAGITYGGTLVITNTGAKLQVGDTFTLFSGTSYTGTFGTLTLPNYYVWNTSQLTVNGSVSITGVLPPPSFNAIDFSTLSSGSLTLNAINGAPGGPVSILSTTNLLQPFASWTVVATGTFDGSGNFSQSISVDPAAPQTFYTLKAD